MRFYVATGRLAARTSARVLFLDRPDKNWSLTDCISFLVMEDRKVRRAFTSDHHFIQAGFDKLM